MKLAPALLLALAFGPGSGAALAAAATDAPVLPPLPERQAPTALTEDSRGDILFDTRSPFDFDVLLNHFEQAPVTTGKGRLFLPAAANSARPVAAMVVLPGSGGISPGREMEMGESLAAQGYAALVVDYYQARGYTPESPYRDKTAGVTEFDVITDAYSALRALARHPAIDPKRVGVMGFSYGGMATRLALDVRVRDRLAPDLAPFAAHVDFYGPCFQDFGTRATTGAPLLSLRGGEDASNDLVGCARDEEALRVAGSAVGSVIYPNAGHSWDVDRPRAKNEFPYVDGCTQVFDELGLPSVNGQAMIPPGTGFVRAARHALRWNSGRFFEGCVKVGYIVGRDEPVKQQSDEQLLRFLRRTLGN